MPLDETDLSYLWDMLQAAKNIRDFVSGITFAQYEQDRKLQLAIERSFEMIGEAAKNVSPDIRKEYPEIPWRAIIGQRNVIAHDYGEVRQERLWLTATVHIPSLIEQLQSLLPEA